MTHDDTYQFSEITKSLTLHQKVISVTQKTLAPL